MKNSGITLITLIITIVSIIIIAMISIYNGYKSPEMANLTGFTSDMDVARVELRSFKSSKF